MVIKVLRVRIFATNEPAVRSRRNQSSVKHRRDTAIAAGGWSWRSRRSPWFWTSLLVMTSFVLSDWVCDVWCFKFRLKWVRASYGKEGDRQINIYKQNLKKDGEKKMVPERASTCSSITNLIYFSITFTCVTIAQSLWHVGSNICPRMIILTQVHVYIYIILLSYFVRFVINVIGFFWVFLCAFIFGTNESNGACRYRNPICLWNLKDSCHMAYKVLFTHLLFLSSLASSYNVSNGWYNRHNYKLREISIQCETTNNLYCLLQTREFHSTSTSKRC